MRTAEEIATEVRTMNQMTVCGEAWQEPEMDFDETVALLTAWEKEIEDEAYERGYNNGYARQKHDRDWEDVEVSL